MYIHEIVTNYWHILVGCLMQKLQLNPRNVDACKVMPPSYQFVKICHLIVIVMYPNGYPCDNLYKLTN